MASVFNKIGDIKNDVKRNSFDWSHDNNFTTDLGRITPVFTELVPPNSSVRIKPEFGLRFMPMMFPIQTKMKAYLSFFKVPLRTLWKDYMDFISADNTEEYQPPFMQFKNSDSDDNGCLVESGLGDYFGMPTTSVVPEKELGLTGRIVDLDPSCGTQVGSMAGVPLKVLSTSVPAAGVQIDWKDSNGLCSIIDCYASLQGTISLSNIPLGSRNGVVNCTFTFSIEAAPSSNAAFPDAFAGSSPCARMFVRQLSAPVTASADYSAKILKEFQIGPTQYSTVSTGGRSNVTFDVTIPVSIPASGDANVYIQLLLPAYKGLINSNGTYWGNKSVTLKSSVAPAAAMSPYYSDGNKTDSAIKISAYPFRAYEAVYNAYIRNTRNNPFILNGKKTYNRWITNDAGGADTTTPKDLRYANWMSDAYTTALQSPQQGNAPLVGLTTYETVSVNEAGHSVTTVNTAIVDENGNAYKVDFESNGEALKGVNYTPLKSGEMINAQALVSPVTSGISINDFRNVNAYQRYLELNQFRGFSYKEIIEGRFDVNVRYDALNMPEYLGGITREVIVNPITQTVETSATGSYQGALGSQSGLATCFGNSDGSISVFCDEESIVMGVMYVVPMPVYDSVLPKWLTYRDRLDSFNPEFDHIGYQPITLKEIAPVQALANAVSLDTVFGYQRPWYEYVQKLDRAHGLFLSSLRNFIMYRSFDTPPELGSEFTTMKPGDVNNVFSVTEVSDKILGQIHFDCTAQLPISRVVVPRLE